MSSFSHLFAFTDYTDFSLIKSLLWGDDKKEKGKEKENKDENKNERKIIKVNKKNKYSNLTEKQKKLILKLEKEIDDFLYRKKVKNLIEKLKDNYMIVCSANIPNLYLNIIKAKKVKQYKLAYEPILGQNVVFLPRKIYRNRKKLKFVIINIKKEIFIEPLYQTEYENGTFVNFIDLQDIKEKELKNEEDFQNFLQNFCKNKKEKLKKVKEKDEKKEEIKKEQENNKKEQNTKIEKKVTENDIIKVNIKTNMNNTKNNKMVRHGRLKSDLDIKNTDIQAKITNSILKNKDISLSGIKSRIKERSLKKVKNERKISFGSVQFSY